ncbi:MAG: 4Fe-4S dicluster domain-containing protein [Gemmatimonadetes bacterium]|nr:MAG: 4Fe-4S dicluster domain-containing protein [Gemmatimonadota bacterium]
MALNHYFNNIVTATTSIFEGMSITFSHLLRKPVTIQYPDRVEKPVQEMLPARYRGILDLDINLCTACTACQRACPIDCIHIDEVKVDKTYIIVPETGRKVAKIKSPAVFNINIAKCMYCGLCTEACSTSAIKHTPKFEMSTDNLNNLILRFVPPEESERLKAEEPEVIKRAEERKAAEAAARAAAKAAEKKSPPDPE